MHPTHHPVADTIATPAAALRDAAAYLTRHGWVQGDFYAHPDRPLTSPACAVGALGLAIHGYQAIETEDDVCDNQTLYPALRLLAEYLFTHGLADGAGPISVLDWNDADGRTADEVIAALLGAADMHDATAARHEPGPLPTGEPR